MSRILLADDSPHAQRMGERLLRDEGYEVVTITDGDTVFVRLPDVDPDVLILDANLPLRSGYEITRFVKSSSFYRHAAVLLTGSVAEPVDESLAREAGARTIGITRMGKSPLARYCDIVLHTVANETRYRPEAMSSRVAQLALIDTLVSCCALGDARRSISRLELSARIIAAKRF